MSKKQKRSDLEKVNLGILMSVIMLLGGLVLGISGLWAISLVVFVLLGFILLVSFIISLFPKRHSKEYNELNPIQKIFATASYLIEMVGYLG